MSNRLTKIGASLAAVAGLAVGGSAIAGAAQKSAPPKPAVSQSQEPSAPDTDNVQQGDQTAPDKRWPRWLRRRERERRHPAGGRALAQQGC